MSDDQLKDEELFPIRELSLRTQVNTVTLRAWERRYGLLKPARTPKGHRLYSDDDVATVERIIALVARGVPISKVKPLLLQDPAIEQPSEGDADWQHALSEFVQTIETYSSHKIERLFHQAFTNYPVPVCRERLIEPLFAELASRSDHGAALGFAESELVRYVSLRLSTDAQQKKGAFVVRLIAGHQTAMWRLAAMALELADLSITTHLLYRAFDTPAAIALAKQFNDGCTVFYQDGLWKEDEKVRVTQALAENPNLYMCGTAPVLSRLPVGDHIFADMKDCIGAMVNLHKTGLTAPDEMRSDHKGE